MAAVLRIYRLVERNRCVHVATSKCIKEIAGDAVEVKLDEGTKIRYHLMKRKSSTHSCTKYLSCQGPCFVESEDINRHMEIIFV